ncbi:MAG: ATP-binding protein [Firmicutes bacterium]|nr:ATP-binding protein [Bacillota bacterium]
MPTAEQLKALIRTHAEGDDERFYAVALQLAAREARQGHTKLAQELRDLVDEVRARPKSLPAKPVPIVQPRGELAGLLSATYPKIRLADMTLDHLVRTRLDRVLMEQRNRASLREHGFSPIRKLLLSGPPGTGKTMTSAALAGELGLALFTIQLDGLITKYLGETAAKLRLIFDAIHATRAVYLFDEFDALGGERSARNDVGEIRRVLTSFLQFLEVDDSDSLIVAATNHPHLLDEALFRRFDSLIEYCLPSQSLAEQLIRARLAHLDITDVDWAKVREATDRLSHADVTRACEQVAKNAILERRNYVRTKELLEALAERRKMRSL